MKMSPLILLSAAIVSIILMAPLMLTDGNNMTPEQVHQYRQSYTVKVDSRVEIPKPINVIMCFNFQPKYYPPTLKLVKYVPLSIDNNVFIDKSMLQSLIKESMSQLI